MERRLRFVEQSIRGAANATLPAQGNRPIRPGRPDMSHVNGVA